MIAHSLFPGMYGGRMDRMSRLSLLRTKCNSRSDRPRPWKWVYLRDLRSEYLLDSLPQNVRGDSLALSDSDSQRWSLRRGTFRHFLCLLSFLAPMAMHLHFYPAEHPSGLPPPGPSKKIPSIFFSLSAAWWQPTKPPKLEPSNRDEESE